MAGRITGEEHPVGGRLPQPVGDPVALPGRRRQAEIVGQRLGRLPDVEFGVERADPDPDLVAGVVLAGSVLALVRRLADACIEGSGQAKARASEVQRGGLDQGTAEAIASATGETGRRGPAKRVVVRRARSTW